MDTMRRIGILGAAALLSIAAPLDPGMGDEGPPRRDRHGKRIKLDPTQFTTSREKSDSLKKLLRK